MNYRSDASGFRPEGFMHIFVVGDTGGTPRQLTDGDFNHNAPEWMPDSQHDCFQRVRANPMPNTFVSAAKFMRSTRAPIK
jgi:hypothetical protein